MELDLQQFSEDFMSQVQYEAEINGTSIEDELTSAILEYIKEDDMTNSPELCFCETSESSAKYGKYKINAFDYSESTGCLDLFGTVYLDKSMSELTANRIETCINKLTKFLKLSITGDIEKIYSESDPDIAEVSRMIASEYRGKKLESIRYFVLSNGVLKQEYSIDDVPFGDDESIICEYYVWDIDYVRRKELAGQQLSEIDIDFANVYQPQIECIKMQDENPMVNSYLAILPAITLAKIYSQYKTKLIDQNVRNFLGKIKVNKGIEETLKKRPEMFFSYNNGISSTASKVDLVEGEDGRKYITNLRNWHIVNGGQTTCTIYNAYKNSKSGADLTKAFVTMKVSEIKNAESSQEIVSSIAEYANSQTKINDSDLSANSKFLCELDDVSKREWTPVNSKKPNTIWYFERLRGQFLVNKLNEGPAYSNKAKKFERERPKSQRFNKTDVAKLEMAWDEMPYESSKGGEVCFRAFWKKDYKDQEVTKEYFHNLIAKKLIYDSIDRLFKESGNKGYGNIVNNYVLAIVSLKTKKRLDLEQIWQSQEVQKELENPIKECIDIVIEHIRQISNDGRNPTVVAKNVDFWNSIKVKIANVQFPEAQLVKEEEEELTPEQIELINNVKKIDVGVWIKLAQWGKRTRSMSIMEKKRIDHLAVAIERENEISYGAAESCYRIYRLAKENGFNE